MPAPFIRWNGGKQRLLKHLPRVTLEDDAQYLEPFVGGGALFLDFNAKNNIIMDVNVDIVNIYRSLQSITTFEILIDTLHEIGDQYSNTKDDYHLARDRFNQLRTDNQYSYERLALFLLLNYYGFNGLYRENRIGHFNGGYGNRKVDFPRQCIDKLETVFQYFQQRNVIIINQDFRLIIDHARTGDYIYFDPPYYEQKTNYQNYTSDGFNTQDHLDLIALCDQLDKRGCKIVYSNSNSDFIKQQFTKLGSHWNAKFICVNRTISNDSSTRKIRIPNEVIFSNFSENT